MDPAQAGLAPAELFGHCLRANCYQKQAYKVMIGQKDDSQAYTDTQMIEAYKPIDSDP